MGHMLILLVLPLFAILLCLAACSRRERPAGVTADATWVEGSKTGYWQRCDSVAGDGIRCTIWNASGMVLLDEQFRPLDSGPRPTLQELKRLRSRGPGTGPYQVCLSNGRILLTNSRYDELKRFVEGRQK